MRFARWVLDKSAAARPSCVFGVSVSVSVLDKSACPNWVLMQRRVLVASLGLRCRLPSWINRPVRIGWYLLASVETENRKRSKPNYSSRFYACASLPEFSSGRNLSPLREGKKQLRFGVAFYGPFQLHLQPLSRHFEGYKFIYAL